MSLYKFSRKSVLQLNTVHPDLQKVVRRALEITEVDFTVIEGCRIQDRQLQLVAEGKSRTKNSSHLTGHAVDLAAWIKTEGLSWSWSHYHKIAAAMKRAAEELAIPIEWGGDWISLKDGAHFQLPWAQYPQEKKGGL